MSRYSSTALESSSMSAIAIYPFVTPTTSIAPDCGSSEGDPTVSRSKVPNSWLLYKNDFKKLYPEICAVEYTVEWIRIASKIWKHERPEIRHYYESQYQANADRAGLTPKGGFRRRRDLAAARSSQRHAERAASGKGLTERSGYIFALWRNGVSGQQFSDAIKLFDQRAWQTEIARSLDLPHAGPSLIPVAWAPPWSHVLQTEKLVRDGIYEENRLPPIRCLLLSDD